MIKSRSNGVIFGFVAAANLLLAGGFWTIIALMQKHQAVVRQPHLDALNSVLLLRLSEWQPFAMLCFVIV